MSELETKMHRHEGTSRYHCVLCGQPYRQSAAAIGLFASGNELGDLCPSCLCAGPKGAAARARRRAIRLQDQARDLAKLADEIDRMSCWNTVEDLRQEEAKVHDEFVAALTAAEVQHHTHAQPGEHDSEYDRRILWSLKP